MAEKQRVYLAQWRRKQAAEKRFETVILSEAKNLALSIFKQIGRARSFAAAQDDTMEGSFPSL
jgi:hypothetical protein